MELYKCIKGGCHMKLVVKLGPPNPCTSCTSYRYPTHLPPFSDSHLFTSYYNSIHALSNFCLVLGRVFVHAWTTPFILTKRLLCYIHLHDNTKEIIHSHSFPILSFRGTSKQLSNSLWIHLPKIVKRKN